MSSNRPNPAEAIARPIHAAVEAILFRATASFAVVVLTVLWAHPPLANAGARVLAHYLLPALLAAYVAVRTIAGVRKRPQDVDAWPRAFELAPAATRLARIAVVGTPLAVAIAGASLIEPHLVDPVDRPWALAIATPALALLWVLATLAWSDDCQGRLAHAATESDARFRAYWSGIGRR